MALGMAKDSMVDLQSLVQGKLMEDTSSGGADTVSLLTTGQSRRCASEYDKLARNPQAAMDEDEVDDDDEQYPLESEEATKLRNSIRGGSQITTNTGESSSSPQPASSPQGGSYLDSSTFMEEEKKQDSYGQYAGFASDYDDYSYDPYVVHYQHTPQTLLGGGKQPSKEGGFLCCLFPWRSVAPAPSDDDEVKEADATGEKATDATTAAVVAEAREGLTNKEPLRKASSSGEDDDLSTASGRSDNLGEKLSEKDRQAVLARLRLAQPDRPSITTPSATDAGEATSPASSGKDKVQRKGLLNEIPNIPSDNDKNNTNDDCNDSKSEMSGNSVGGHKGILKRQSTVIKTPEPQTGATSRRSLFPTYETNNKTKKSNLCVQFAPMARVVTVKSQKEMTPEEKSAVWWQKWDYEDFRKTGRIITRAMLEGGSEIWLASNQSWQHQGSSKQTTLKNAMSMTEKNANNGKRSGSETADLIRSNSDKWWHKFGHSRRGLEHIASIKEGSERQANVRHAIRSTLDEQRRQKAYLREDPDKLRMVCIHNTSWARDLALASGSSDADAVKSNFDEERKSREFYLLKMARTNSISSKGKHVPAFMKPAISATFAQKLDANTSAQIMYRRKQQRAMLQAQQVQTRESVGSDSTSSGGKQPTKRASMPPIQGGKLLEAIHDPEPPSPQQVKKESIAKRAAGFSHDGAEQVNMAAVLSGMGAVPKNAQTVGA